MGQEKCTGEFKNTHTISVANTERKRHFGRARSRRNVKENVVKCTKEITIPVAFH
jgi:type IV secretory pathway VirD2 relaxase